MGYARCIEGLADEPSLEHHKPKKWGDKAGQNTNRHNRQLLMELSLQGPGR
jgi:hypothetical protein